MDEIKSDDPDNPPESEALKEVLKEAQEQADATQENEFVSPAEALKGINEIPQVSKTALAEAMQSAVVFTHHEIAVYTGFSQWELDPVEQQHFQNFFNQVAPLIPIEWLGPVIGIIVIGMIEIIKTRAYLTFLKAMKERGQ